LVGDCGALGGLARLAVGTNETSSVVTPAPNGTEPDPGTVCGQRPVLLSASSIAVARLQQLRASPNVPGTVDVVDLNTGRVLRSLSLPADAIDLLAP
jgi:hypothetical protein